MTITMAGLKNEMNIKSMVDVCERNNSMNEFSDPVVATAFKKFLESMGTAVDAKVEITPWHDTDAKTIYHQSLELDGYLETISGRELLLTTANRYSITYELWEMPKGIMMPMVSEMRVQYVDADSRVSDIHITFYYYFDDAAIEADYDDFRISADMAREAHFEFMADWCECASHKVFASGETLYNYVTAKDDTTGDDEVIVKVGKLYAAMGNPKAQEWRPNKSYLDSISKITFQFVKKTIGPAEYWMLEDRVIRYIKPAGKKRMWCVDEYAMLRDFHIADLRRDGVPNGYRLNQGQIDKDVQIMLASLAEANKPFAV